MWTSGSSAQFWNLYSEACTIVRTYARLRESFEVKVGLHKGSLLNPPIIRFGEKPAMCSRRVAGTVAHGSGRCRVRDRREHARFKCVVYAQGRFIQEGRRGAGGHWVLHMDLPSECHVQAHLAWPQCTKT